MTKHTQNKRARSETARNLSKFWISDTEYPIPPTRINPSPTINPFRLPWTFLVTLLNDLDSFLEVMHKYSAYRSTTKRNPRKFRYNFTQIFFTFEDRFRVKPKILFRGALWRPSKSTPQNEGCRSYRNTFHAL